eukprot:scaffold29371_cov101-Isochrysis_galbana.AAC.2
MRLSPGAAAAASQAVGALSTSGPGSLLVRAGNGTVGGQLGLVGLRSPHSLDVGDRAVPAQLCHDND